MSFGSESGVRGRIIILKNDMVRMRGVLRSTQNESFLWCVKEQLQKCLIFQRQYIQAYLELKIMPRVKSKKRDSLQRFFFSCSPEYYSTSSSRINEMAFRNY